MSSKYDEKIQCLIIPYIMFIERKMEHCKGFQFKFARTFADMIH